jgi:hypothetical protein
MTSEVLGAGVTSLRADSTFDAEQQLAGGTRLALAEVEAAIASPVTGNGQLAVPLLDRLLDAVIPALEAQAEVLSPMPEQEIGQALLAARWRLGLIAEQLSRLAATRQPTSPAFLASIAEALAELLSVQQRAAHALRQSAGRSRVAALTRLLEVSEARVHEGLLFVDPPHYGPTEAQVLRHNPRPARLLRLREMRLLPRTD